MYYFARYVVGMSEAEAALATADDIVLAWDIKCRSYGGAVKKLMGFGGD